MAGRCSNHPNAYGAGCPACRELAAAYFRRRYRLLAYGQWKPTADAAPVREHVQRLRAAGVTTRQIARAAGIGKSTLIQIDKRTTVFTETAERVLAVTVADAMRAQSNRNMVDATGAVRRLRALSALGWSPADLGEHMSIDKQSVRRWMTGHWQQITVANARRIAAVYAELSDRDGPSPSAARRAARSGWHAPIAWDDDTIDDPKAKPMTAATRFEPRNVSHACAGGMAYKELSLPERAEAIRRLNAAGLNDRQIADVLQVAHNTIGQRRIRMGLPSRYDPASYLGRAS